VEILFDFDTNAMGHCFTEEPDFTAYQALPSDLCIFDPRKALDPLDEEFKWEAALQSPKLDDPDQIRSKSP
jgi:hypothetical protein